MLISDSIRQRARRKVIRSRFGFAALEWRLVQPVLRFQKTHQGIIDNLGHVILEYDPRTVIGNQLFLRGGFEEDEIHFFQRLLSGFAAPVVLDVGANIGLHAVTWAKAISSACVYAFEPSRQTAGFLRRNVALNGLGGRIVVIEEALSDKAGQCEFFHCEDDAYSSLKDTHRKRVVDAYLVRVTTIDDFVSSRGLERINLIKIDVEGLEHEVLLGARQTLSELRPYLFVEIFGGTHSNPDPAGTVRYVQSMGYDAFALRQGIPEKYTIHSDSLYNYYFRPAH
jgi:FkbM family methyltransferase